MTWQMLLIINLIAASIREFLNKRVANKMSPFVGLFYIVLFGQIWTFIAYVATSGVLPRWDFSAALPGLIFVISFSAYFAALKISLSQTILFQSYSILVTVILSAIFLGEGRYLDVRTLTGVKVIFGIILAFSALWYLLHVGNKKEERLERKWFYYILIVIIFGGIGSFWSISTLSKLTPMEMLLNQGNLMIAVLLLIMFSQKQNIRIGKRKILLTLINSIFATIAVIAFYNALIFVPVAKFFPLQQVSLVIITIMTGYFFYGEKEIFTGRHLVGMGLGLAGILLLVTS